MCERYSFTLSKEKINKYFGIKVTVNPEKQYHIEPGQLAPVITNEEPSKLQTYRWGLIPEWAPNSNVGSNLYNAVAEGIQSRPSFRISVRKRRCLILADGYYDFKKLGRSLIPYRITHHKADLLVMAGLWDVWRGGTPEEIRTFSVITVPAGGVIATINSRMPAFLPTREEQQAWLELETYEAALRLLKTADDSLFRLYPITDKIKTPGYSKSDLHTEMAGPPSLFD